HAELFNYARLLAEGIVNAVRQPLLALDGHLRVVAANRAFYRAFRTSASQTKDRLVYELGHGHWDHPDLRHLLEEIIPQDNEFDGFELVHDFPGIGRKRAVLDARRIDQDGELPDLILLTVRELIDA
ncbi:MAG: histidine kinase, partial [Patescibacteria group bacterium]|nr:histidine kinase [Patescibacteria group bacterium]